MADVPERYVPLLHGIRTSGADANGRTALDAEVRILLMQDQIESADKIAKASKQTADSLAHATWVLSAATVVLAITTVILVVVTASQ